MEKIKISVIVPVYNVDTYLVECLDSILSQTYKNLEIIIVDDGSTDNSGNICEEYAGRDRRIRVIHQKNAGLSAARNTGLEYVTGDFVAFIDSDDWIETRMLEELLKQILCNHTEMALCNVRRFSDEDGSEEEVVCMIKDEILSRNTIVKRLTEQQNWYYTVAWNKLYKTEIFDDIRFPVGYIHEDEAVIHYILSKCKNIVCTQQKLYHYRKRANSITGDSKTINRTDILTALADRIEYADRQKWEVLREETTKRYVNVLFEWTNYLVNNCNSKNKYMQRVKRSLKVSLPYILKNKNIRWTQKVWCIVFDYSPELYKVLNKLCGR